MDKVLLVRGTRGGGDVEEVGETVWSWVRPPRAFLSKGAEDAGRATRMGERIRRVWALSVSTFRLGILLSWQPNDIPPFGQNRIPLILTEISPFHNPA